MFIDVKTKENQLRRQLKKSGYYLRKSRLRNKDNITIDDFGGYMILAFPWGGIVAGSRFSWELDDVADFVFELSEINLSGGTQ
jgi:hypothetical protein